MRVMCAGGAHCGVMATINGDECSGDGSGDDDGSIVMVWLLRTQNL